MLDADIAGDFGIISPFKLTDVHLIVSAALMQNQEVNQGVMDLTIDVKYI